MKSFLSTFLKGKLEGLSWGTFLTVLITEKSSIIESFNSGGEAGVTALLFSAASLAGAIWGKLRRNTEDYNAK